MRGTRQNEKGVDESRNEASKMHRTLTIEMQVEIGIFTPRIGDFNTRLSVRYEIRAQKIGSGYKGFQQHYLPTGPN